MIRWPRKNKMIKRFIIGMLACMPLIGRAEKKLTPVEAVKDTLFSPDKNTCFVWYTKNGTLLYRVMYRDQLIIDRSELGFVINGQVAGPETKILKSSYRENRERFPWRLGENDSVSNNYNQVILNCRSNNLRYDLIVRTFNGSVGFRYRIPPQAAFKKGGITGELTTFVFNKPLTLYQYNEESVFTPVKIDSLKKSCDLPVTLTDYKDVYISIGEADNEDYTKSELTKGKTKNSLKVSFLQDSVVQTSGSFETPWRTISFSNTAVGLHAYGDLNLRLVDSENSGVPEWIVPGKLIRAQLSTESGIRCVDFAAKHNFQYVLFDAGWYGKEFNSVSDPRTYIKGLDMPEVIRYGASKNVGVILYVNYVGLKKYLDDIIPLYKKWGVAGMKFGFVDGLSQNGIRWLMSAVKKANDAGFIIDVHDNYKPTGMSRKYPGLLTQEGVRGNENAPDAFHTTVLPFTRFLAGPADFTFCYPNAKESFSSKLKVSKGQQLALSVIFFSPLQAIFWYGKPEDYTNEKEIEFFKYVPTVWDESHYLKGEIGKYISVARRSGDIWFVGNAAGMNNWGDTIKLDFLNPGKRYTVAVYEDDGEGGIHKSMREVKKGDTFPIAVKAAGGQALIIKPSDR